MHSIHAKERDALFFAAARTHVKHGSPFEHCMSNQSRALDLMYTILSTYRPLKQLTSQAGTDLTDLMYLLPSIIAVYRSLCMCGSVEREAHVSIWYWSLPRYRLNLHNCSNTEHATKRETRVSYCRES
jgi:hypothetical protein